MTEQSSNADADSFLRLLPGEELIRSEPAPLPAPSELVPAELELARLSGVSRFEDIGTKGPPVGALSLKSGSQREYLRLFEAVFGRDSLMMSLGLVNEYPRLAETTVLYLASQQGVALDVAPEPDAYDRRGEAPGRIPHEIRDPRDPVARKLSENNGWGWPYYAGQVDANDLFVLVVAALAARDPAILHRLYVGRDGRQHALSYALGQAFLWGQSQSDNGEHLMECRRARIRENSPARGQTPVAYPTWQDSPDSTMRADGSLCVGSVALAELQANRYDALAWATSLARAHPDLEEELHITPDDLERQAEVLRSSTIDLFWGDEPGLPVVAYGLERRHDGSLQPLRVRKSNAGHLLNCAILEGAEYADYTHTLVRQLLHPDEGLICPAGVRTLSSKEALFRPCAYHNGTVWLWDSLWIACGLRRHGYHRCAKHLFETTIRICEHLHYYPEHVRGLDTVVSVNDRITVVESHDPFFGPWRNQVEQPPQLVQGWTVMAYLVAQRELRTQKLESDEVAPHVDDLDRELAEAIRRAFASV